jgi:hypothetical protein
MKWTHKDATYTSDMGLTIKAYATYGKHNIGATHREVRLRNKDGNIIAIGKTAKELKVFAETLQAQKEEGEWERMREVKNIRDVSEQELKIAIAKNIHTRSKSIRLFEGSYTDNVLTIVYEFREKKYIAEVFTSNTRYNSKKYSVLVANNSTY